MKILLILLFLCSNILYAQESKKLLSFLDIKINDHYSNYKLINNKIFTDKNHNYYGYIIFEDSRLLQIRFDKDGYINKIIGLVAIDKSMDCNKYYKDVSEYFYKEYGGNILKQITNQTFILKINQPITYYISLEKYKTLPLQTKSNCNYQFAMMKADVLKKNYSEVSNIKPLTLKGITLDSHYSKYEFKDISKIFKTSQEYTGYLIDEKNQKLFTEINKDGIIKNIVFNRVDNQSVSMCQKNFQDSVDIIKNDYSSYPLKIKYSSSKLFDKTASKDIALIEIGNPKIATYYLQYSLKPLYFKTSYKNHCEFHSQLYK